MNEDQNEKLYFCLTECTVKCQFVSLLFLLTVVIIMYDDMIDFYNGSILDSAALIVLAINQ
jgi:hypothetical protein